MWPPQQMDLKGCAIATANNDGVSTVKNANVECTAVTLMQDTTLAARRISWMLQRVSLAKDTSDKLRREALEEVPG